MAIMAEQATKTLTPNDVYDAFNGKDIDHSSSLLSEDYTFEV
jgi:hypothetical protein